MPDRGASTAVEAELVTQPSLWRLAAGLADGNARALPNDDERVAVLGCGTSLFVAQAYAELREAAGRGETDAFPASAHRWRRTYDRVLLVSRSGTTTEVLDALDRLDGTPATVITAVGDAPLPEVAEVVVLDEAAERSVVQTRFPTTVLAMLRASLGESLDQAVADAEWALAGPLPIQPGEHHQLTFLGMGWAAALAAEAALKCREAAGWWTESYLATEFRHGPIAVSGPGSVVWFLGAPPDGLVDQVTATGATVVTTGRDPMADLVAIHRLAVGLATAAGRDPDAPRALSYSVVLHPT